MLLDEDPAALIQECIGNFNIAPDRSALTRITTSLHQLSSTRATSLSTQHSALARLQRQQHTLEQQHNLSVGSHDPAAHAAAILALDGQKFRVAKDASDLEIEGEKLEAELGSVERQLRDIGAREGDGASEWSSRGRELQDVLRLQLYRSLGVELESDGNGGFRRAIFQNAKRGDAKVLDLDSRQSRSQLVNDFWEAM